MEHLSNNSIEEFKNRIGLLETIGTDNQKLKEKFHHNREEFKVWFESEIIKFFEGNYQFDEPRISKSKYLSEKPLWRISSHDNIEKKHWSNFACAPDTKFMGLNRCNYPFEPVLYVNCSGAGCFSEVFKNGFSSKEGKNIVVSEWRLKKDHSFMLYATPEKSNHPIIKNLYDHIYEGLKKLTGVNEKDFQNFMNCISEQFLIEDNYTASAFLSQHFIYDPNSNHTGVIYPSVRHKKSFNLALNKNIVDNPEYFEFKEANEIDLYNFLYNSDTGEIDFTYQTIANYTALEDGSLKRVENKGELITKKFTDHELVV